MQMRGAGANTGLQFAYRGLGYTGKTSKLGLRQTQFRTPLGNPIPRSHRKYIFQ